jgi:BTB/POZ domain-containing protein KCTD9
MSRLHDRIPEDQAQEVFTLAAQLYAQHNQSYSVHELMEAGAEAKIPPEFVQQAIDQLQITPVQQSALTDRTKRAKGYLAAIAIGLPLLAAIAAAWWLVARNAATSAQVQQPPAQTVQPIPNQPPLSGTNSAASNFKCARLDLRGQDLRTKNFKNADCTEAKLAGANLSGTNMESANLSRAELNDANLKGANLKNVDLAGANLAGADLTNANLEDANLSNTDLRGANLKDAKIDRTDLAGAKVNGIDLKGAN